MREKAVLVGSDVGNRFSMYTTMTCRSFKETQRKLPRKKSLCCPYLSVLSVNTKLKSIFKFTNVPLHIVFCKQMLNVIICGKCSNEL